MVDKMKFRDQFSLGVLAIFLSACGGGGGSSSDPLDIDGNEPTQQPFESIPGSQLLTGRFVDSAVSGLRYETASQSGITDSDGSFDYLPNETVTFSLGDIVLPAVEASSVVTPLDVFSTTEIGDNRVINLTRLLQTLDVDGDPDNGITLSDDAAASATGLSVDFATTEVNFDSQVVNLVANSGSPNFTLIDGETALDHFVETLFDEGIMERPSAPSAPDTSGDSGSASSTHPLVGTSAEFSNFSHDIGGTLTVIDDRTLEVTNFTYDGGGPSVLFYLGTDGDFSPIRGGIPVGERLNGRVFNGETIRIDLPDGVTLDDFNGVSVWCDLFGIDFGSANL